MKLSRVLPFVYLGLLLFGTTSFFVFKKQNKIFPRATEIQIEDESGEEQARLKWIAQMHKAAPGTDWKLIEYQNRIERYKNTNHFRISATTSSDTIANGALTGSWSEKGSINQAGRMVAADFDSINNLIYAGSAGGVVWKGNTNGTNWIPLNDKLRFDNILMVRVIPHNGGTRIVVVTGGVPFLFTSDNGGNTWSPTTGLSTLSGFGNIVRGVVVDDSLKTIYLLSSQMDHITFAQKTGLYMSTDHGNSFTVVRLYDESVYGNTDAFDLWAPRYGNTSAYLINQNSADLTLYKLNPSTGIPQQESQNTIAAGGKVLLTGYVSNPLTLYVYSDKHVYRSLDGGMTWVLRSTLAQEYYSRYSFSCSMSFPNTVFFGGVEAYRTVNGASSWTRVNAWSQYYGNPAAKLHADVFCIIPYFDVSEKEFIGTDGGLFYSADTIMSTVTNLSLSGLNVSQYYSTYSHRTDTNIIYAGAQDQGFQRCQLSNNVSQFEQVISGDYGHIVSATGGNDIWTVYPSFAGYTGNAKTNQNWFTGTWDFNGATQFWLPPLMADPLGAPDICYLAGTSISSGGSHIIKLDASGGNTNINATELPYDFSWGGNVSAMSFNPANPAEWYVVTDNGSCFYSSDTGQTFSHSTMSVLPDPHYFYGNAIYVMKTQPGKIFVGGSGYSNAAVYKSSNHGSSFTTASSGLPATLVYELAADPNEDFIFAATESGPYVYVVAQNQWYPMATPNSPDQVYWSVDYVPQTNTVRFGTYGRGIWDFHIESGLFSTITENNKSFEVSIYPNPSNGILSIKTVSKINQVRIFDQTGKLTFTDASGKSTIDISGNRTGVYYVEVLTEMKRYVQKVLLQ
jgi:hypothetical protein